MDHRLSDAGLLNTLYAAPLEAGKWVSALEMLADSVGGNSAWISKLNIRDGRGEGITSRLDPAWQKAYGEHFFALNPFSNTTDPDEYARTWRPEIFTEQTFPGVRNLARSSYFNEFMAPQEVHGVMIVRLALKGDIAFALNINRPQSKPGFGVEEMKRIRSVHHHLIRALHLSESLSQVAERNAQLREALFTTAAAILIVGHDGRTEYANRAAEIILSEPGGLTIRGGRLVAESTNVSSELETAIAAAGSADVTARSGGSLVVPDGRGGGWRVEIAPLRERGGGFFGHRTGVIVSIEATTKASTPLPELMATFGLTAAEARVATAIASGLRIREAAERLSVSRNTLRVHLANIFEKTGVSRQADLVRLLMRG